MKTIKVNGLNLNRLIDQIINSGAHPQNIKRTAYDEIIFEISNIEYKNLVANKILSCYNISVIKETPTHSFFLMCLKRSGLLAGFLIAIIVLIGVVTKIWQVDIEVIGENSAEIESKIQNVLLEKGIYAGSSFNYSTKKLEQELLSTINESASVYVNKSGTKLEILVKTIVEKPVLSTQDIVAGFDGVVTDIKLKSGILTVNIGEGVSKGQVLIASGVVGDYYAEAIGEITGKVLISGTAVGTKKTTQLEKTGEVITLKAYNIFGKSYFWGESIEDVTNRFQGVEVEKTSDYCFPNTAVPLKIETYKIYVLEEKETILNEDELVESLKEQARKIAESNMPAGAQAGAITYDQFNENGVIKIVCNIETVVSIGIAK